MIPADVMMQLATLGLTADQARVVSGMLSAVEAATKADAESGIEAGREKARARWHKWKDSQPTNVSKRLQPLANDSQQLAPDHAHVEDNLPSKKITGKEENKKTPRDELAAVLDAERADAVVEHRQRLRKPLTSRAAKMLAVELAKAPDANAAADLMLAKGWAGFDIGWLESRNGQQRATAPPEPRNAGERARLKLNGTIPHEPPHSAPGRLDTGDGRRQIEGPGIARGFALPPDEFSRN